MDSQRPTNVLTVWRQNLFLVYIVVLRDLPSLTVAFHEFEVAQASDPAIRAVLAQEGLSQHSNNFEREYLKSIVASANVENMYVLSFLPSPLL